MIHRFFMSKFIRHLLYVLTAILAFELAWFVRPKQLLCKSEWRKSKLDEIRILPKTITEYVYQDRIVREKQKRWRLRLSAGYGLSKNGLSTILAVTVNYNLFSW